MNFTLKHIIPKVNNLIIGSFISSFCLGCFPNKIHINFEGEKYRSLQAPLISGLLCSTGMILSPFLMINYFCNGTYFDKLIDKYDVNIKRYHQYAYPSLLIINIQSKDLTNNNDS